MAQIRNTIFVERVDNPTSPADTIDGVNSRSVRILDVAILDGAGEIAWTTKQQAVKDILGYAFVDDAGGGQFINRVIPMQHPEFSWLWAGRIDSIVGIGPRKDPATGQIYTITAPTTDGTDQVNVEDYAGEGGYDPSTYAVPQYRKYRCTVAFNALPYDIISNSLMPSDANGNPDEASLLRWVTKLPKPGGYSMILPTGAMRLVRSDKAPVPYTLNKVCPEFDVSICHHWVPAEAVGSNFINPDMVYAPIDELLGTVNTVKFYGQNPGELLYVACEMIPDRFANGDRAWQIYHRFKWRETKVADIGSHNALAYPNGATPPVLTWYEVSTDGGTHALNVPGKHMYDGSDFADLFRVSA